MAKPDRTAEAISNHESAFQKPANLGVWSAPGRINLIGGHTDYNNGIVLPFAIEERTYVAIGADRPEGAAGESSALTVHSSYKPNKTHRIEFDALRIDPEALQQRSRANRRSWVDYVAGVIWALTLDQPEALDEMSSLGLRLSYTSNVPAGSGLSSSAALLCSTAVALNEILDLGASVQDLVAATIRAENDYVGAPTGGMDQLVSLSARDAQALRYDIAANTVEQIGFDPKRDGLSVLVVNTNVKHSHATGEYGSRRDECEVAAAKLGVNYLREVSLNDLPQAETQLDDDVLFRRVRHVVSEIARVEQACDALRSADYAQLGALMTKAHASARDDFEISCPELDTAVKVTLAEGGLGARMTGGGFGGSAIALVATAQADHITNRLSSVFAAKGFRAPSIYSTTPSEGARRELSHLLHRKMPGWPV